MTARSIDVRGRKVALLESGSGEPTLYLHGFADVHGVDGGWTPFHESLAAATRLIAPAHPGCNGSDDLPEGRSVEDAVFHYLEVLDALGLQRFNLVGHSVGGWIAAEIAVRHPEKVKRLALIGASGLFLPGEPIADIFMHTQPEHGVDYASLRRMLFSASDAAPALRYYPNGRGDMEEEVRRYQMIRFGSFIGFKPPYFYHRSLADRLYRANMPALAIWGAEDRFVPRAHGQAYAAGLPGCAPLRLVEGAGHAAHLEAPRECAQALASFLAV
ncbi:MAG: alpha/beta hydrolase [Hyphomicrobiales bacterium]|nr:alpha/beta hydrolase [Hyphomicrobiales bacterium]